MGNSLDKCCSQPGHVNDSGDLSRSILTVENPNSFIALPKPKDDRILEDSREDEESEEGM